MRKLVTGLLCAALIALPAAAADKTHNANVTVVFHHVLPNVLGAKWQAIIIA